MVLVCHRHRFIFIKTRKTAGTSVEAALQVLMGDNVNTIEETTNERVARAGIVGRRLQGKSLKPGEDSNNRVRTLQQRYKASFQRNGKHYHRPTARWYHHKPAWEVKRDLGDGIFNSYLKITVVRNPWDKVVSLWKWQTLNGATKLPFKTYVMRMAHSDDWHLYSINNRRVCDSHIRFEDLEGGLRRVMAKLAVPEEEQSRVLAALPHYKDSHERDALAYRDYYDVDNTEDEMQLHVAQLYKKEIAHFHYSF